MRDSLRIQIPKTGAIWCVEAGHFGTADVVIPTDQIHDLSDREIGMYVRMLAPEAERLYAASCAEDIYDSFYAYTADKPQPWKIDPSVVEHKALLQEFARFERDGQPVSDEEQVLIELALEVIDAYETYIESKARIKSKRQDIQRNYDSIFVKIGRRDGFRCVHCSSSDDLAIDHIIALARGGTNDLENLQLLCRSCNSRKGAR